MYGIPVPRYACVNRKVPNQDLHYFVEEEDFVEVHGERFWKPFVEKPVNGELASGYPPCFIYLLICSIFIFLLLANY